MWIRVELKMGESYFFSFLSAWTMDPNNASGKKGESIVEGQGYQIIFGT